MRPSRTLSGSLSDQQGINAAFLARCLTWAADRKLPVEEVTREVQPSSTMTVITLLIGNPLALTFAGVFAGPRAIYGLVMWTLQAKLENGRDPAEVVREKTGSILPGYLREAVAVSLERPDLRGRLASLLDEVSHRPVWTTQVMARLTFPLVYLGLMAYAVMRVSWMMRRLVRYFEVEGAVAVIAANPLFLLASVITMVALSCGIIAVILAIWLRRLPPLRVVGEYLCRILPGVGSIYLNTRAREGALSVYTGMGMGMALEDALSWSMEQTDSPWLHRRLRLAGEEMDRGHGWADAWVAAGLTRSRGWELATARLREDPMLGFRTLADRLESRLELQTRRLEAVFEVIRVLVVGALAALFCSAVYLSLAALAQQQMAF